MVRTTGEDVMHRLVKSFALFVFIIGFTGFIHAQTHISGGILPNNTVWTAANSPYIIDGTVTVGQDSSLTVNPGVTVEFSAGTSMMVNGLFVADGKPDSLITFTSSAGTPSPGDWGQIEFSNTTDPATVFDNCVLEYGGGGTRSAILFYASGAPTINITNSTVQYSAGDGITVRTSQLQIFNSDFSNNAGWGIYGDVLMASGTYISSSTLNNNTTGGLRIPTNSLLTADTLTIDGNGTGIYVGIGANPQINNSTITHNTNGVVSEANADPVFRNCNFVDNTNYGIDHPGPNRIDARWNYWGDYNGPTNEHYNPAGNGDRITDYVDFEPFTATTIVTQITQVTTNIGVNTTWDNGIYVINNRIEVSAGDSLTIKPGVIVKFMPNSWLRVFGTLYAVGRADSSVVFTSYKDDSYGGDTNGDGHTSSPSPGDWQSLRFESSSSGSVLRNVIAKFGGQYSASGLIEIYSGATPTIDSSFVSRSSDDGIYISSSTGGTISNTYITGNSYEGVNLTSNSTFSFMNCVFQGNAHNGIYAHSSSTPTLVEDCVFSNNGYNGVNVESATQAQSIQRNEFSNNGIYGMININSASTDPHNVVIDSNSFTDNSSDGLVSSAAQITSNTFTGNNYPLSITGIVGNIYTPTGQGTDDNQISGNTYDNAVGLRGNAYISGTLNTVFPQAINSKVYVVTGNYPRVTSGTTLTITPGVIIKFEPNQHLNVDGTLISRGTPDQKIVFTSYRDSTYGGKTNAATDNNGPAAGDWENLYLNGSGANSSRINYAIFHYGGDYPADGILHIVNVSSDTVFSFLDVKHSSRAGIYFYNSGATLSNCVSDSNSWDGIRLRGGTSDVRVTSSYFRDNGQNGLSADNGSTFREVSNNQILRNGGNGIYSNFGIYPVSIVGNTVANNGSNGIYVVASVVTPPNLQIGGNIIQDNAKDGVVSSGAHFTENQFIGNRYPIGVTGKLGNYYHDQTGADENTFTNNTYNNAIALRSDVNLSDTLSYDFPDSIDSHTYVVVDGKPRVPNGNTLTIEPGVIVKFTQNQGLNVDGTLIAQGTSASKITFTSWHDSTVGGKTDALTDNSAPSIGDWENVYVNSSNATNLLLNYCVFKYGGDYPADGILDIRNVSLSNSIMNVLAMHSRYSGIFLYNSVATFDTVESDSNNYNGIRIRGNSSDVRVRYGTFLSNGLDGGSSSFAGLTADNGSGFREISNSTISSNDGAGIYSNFANIPQTFVDNTISGNAGDGIFTVMRNDAVDSLLSITGNTIENNTTEGIVSSRAIIKQNTIQGNRYPIAVTGQVSLAGSSTENGNVYGDNLIENNQYNNAVGIRGDVDVDGLLGGSFPDSVSSNTYVVINDVTVSNGRALDILPGTVIKFHSGASLQSRGVLTALGTSNSRIIFTSWKDDAFGGDTNEDSTATSAAPDDWGNVQLYDTGSNGSRLSHIVIRFGGQYPANENLYLLNTNAQVDSSFITFAGGYGINSYNASSLLYSLELHDNVTGLFVRAYNSSVPQIHQSNIYNNTDYGVQNGTPGDTVDATLNYWGAATGPYNASLNPSGEGDAVSSGVKFEPYLHAQQGPLLGDVSLNGAVTAFDASLVLRHSVGLITLTGDSLIAAEVSGQDPVTAYDASLILQYVAGVIITFPALGKPIQPAALAQAISMAPASGDAGTTVEMPIKINGDFRVTSTDLHLTYDPNVIESISVRKSEASQGMQLVTNTQGDTLKIAMAGSQPIDLSQPIMTLVLHLKSDVSGQAQSSINFLTFRVNDVNLTSHMTGVDVNVRGTPTTYKLSQNYPNPFNPTTTIQYQLPENSKVLLAVYNLKGQKIATLVNQVQKAGYYQVTWDGTNQFGQHVASGVYFYRVKAVAKNSDKSMTQVKKMMFLK